MPQLCYLGRIRPGGAGKVASSGGTPFFLYPFWNPLDKGTFCVLSNGLLTASHALNDFDFGQRSEIAKSSGKWFWEITYTSGASPALVVGIGKAGSSYRFPGFDANGWGYSALDGKKYTNNVGTSYGATYATGDVIGVALDMDAGTLTFYKNGVSQGIAYSGLSGTMFAATGLGTGIVASDTANFGASAFAFTAPVGFNVGLYESSLSITYATYDPLNKGPDSTLSNGNRTLTGTAGPAGSATSTIGKTRGRWYWEAVMDAGASSILVGIDEFVSTHNYPGFDARSVGYHSPGGNRYISNVPAAYGASFTVGDVIGIALDRSGRTLTFYKNNVSQGATDLASLLGLSTEAMFASITPGGNGFSTTTNFGASPLVYAPPAGYQSGLYNLD